MKKNIITLLAVVLSATAFAQVKNGVGFGAKKVFPSAALQIDATDKGVLIPRVEIKDLAAYGLAGTNTAGVEGMIVFNKTAVANTDATKAIAVGFHYWSGAKWELVTSQSQLNTVVETIKEEVKTEIEKITDITGGTAGDNSYLVSFKPDADGADGTTGDLSYLYPKKDAQGNIIGYDKKSISFEELVKSEETATFIREITKTVKDENNVDVEKVVGYVYFGEAAIRQFKADKPKEDISKITDNYGITLDISTVVTNNTKDIFNDKETVKEITSIVENAVGVVRVVENDKTKELELVYKDKVGGDDLVYNINVLETKTHFKRFVAKTDGAIADNSYEAVITKPTTAKVGEIIYQYFGENAAEPNFINITADVVTTIKENKEVKETFDKTVVEYLSKGGNVYYGIINDPATGKPFDAPVLFEKKEVKDPAGGPSTFKEEPIDIAKDILKVIEKDNTLIERIKELTNTKIETGKDLPTGETINGKAVYKGFATITVKDDDKTGYDSTLRDGDVVTVSPHKITVDKDGNAKVEPVDAKFGRLLRVSVLEQGGSVVIDSATDVTKVGNTGKDFTFYFGLGNMYTPIKDGKYDLVFEYVVE